MEQNLLKQEKEGFSQRTQTCLPARQGIRRVRKGDFLCVLCAFSALFALKKMRSLIQAAL
jgi:hypothetical protein